MDDRNIIPMTKEQFFELMVKPYIATDEEQKQIELQKSYDRYLKQQDEAYITTRHYNDKEVKVVCTQPMSENKIKESVKNLVERNGEVWDSKLYHK